MKDKSFAVIGMGQFGKALAVTLADANYDVMVIDENEENIQEIEERVAYAVKADVREPGILKSLGVQNVDVCVIAVSENLEASITATIQAKDLGVPLVIAKATNALHGRILTKIGADEIVYPEQAMGLRVARNLTTSGFVDMFELSPDCSIAEFKIPAEWVGKSLTQLNVRGRYNINIIGIKKDENVDVNVSPDVPLPDACMVIAIGNNNDLNAEPIFRV